MKRQVLIWIFSCLLNHVPPGSFQIHTSGSFFQKIFGDEIDRKLGEPIIKREFFRCDRENSCSNVVRLKSGKYRTVAGEAEMKDIKNAACVWRKFSPSTQHKKEKTVCLNAVGPLGMESKEIPDNRITASSNHQGTISQARLMDWDSWIAAGFGTNEYLQVDFAKMMLVHAVATQGNSVQDFWVYKYEISFCTDGVTFTTIMSDSQTALRFNGNNDRNTIVENTFPSPVAARYIRINPKQFYSAIAMRAELYGCDLNG